jgi:pimeloyl-ACP methyl ester carboxylesterase
MPQITTYDGMTFEYETAGSPGDPPVLMAMGFATQLVGWPRAFCELLAQGGRFVISFDNRDCGLSAKLEGRDAHLDEVMTAAAGGDFEAARALAPYTLSDMADDGFAAASYDRCNYPAGTRRQLAAMLASGPRADGLTRLRMPTLVIHGLDDTLIDPSGGERTAALVPGANLLLIEDMGHDRPRALRPRISQAILDHTAEV